ncbi:MAG TPA: hypothetical protein PKE39_11930 [Ignavibacteria bacterium]|nr:hypothetical protein [Ignavibacteria bacterium]HMQ99723.1 hypothetical protein [Ignavibacteria bacterium]
MKTLKIFIALFFIFAGFTAYSQQTNVIAVINKANWCNVCKTNGEKVTMLTQDYMDKNIKFLMNDLTDDATKKESQTLLETNGVNGFLVGVDMTGIITIIDLKQNKIIETISVSKDTAELKNAIDNAISGHN